MTWGPVSLNVPSAWRGKRADAARPGVLDGLRCLEAPLAHADDLTRVHHSAYVDLIFEHAPLEG
jgi:hypothetical protein